MSDIQLKDNLSKLRKEQNLTQKQLAELINYSDKVISKWERGESYPDLLALKQLSAFFKVSIDEVIGTSKLEGDPITQVTNKLDVIKTKQPSFIARVWILIPLVPLVISISFGPEVFGLSLFIYGLLLFLYPFTVANHTFETVYKGNTISLVNNVKSLELYINNELVDGVYSTFAFNPILIGKIDEKIIRVRVSGLILIRCSVFVS